MEILGKKIRPGVNNCVEVQIASLYTRTRIDVPVIVQTSSKPGPCLLVLSGIHGDEVNGIEINRRLIFEKQLKPDCGTIISVPTANVMAFLNLDRKFPDGRDLNRSFPGSSKGSLAAKVAHMISTKIVPHADYVVDLHTGAVDRTNYPQIRFDEHHPDSRKMADAFNAYFTLKQPTPPRGSIRRLLRDRGIPSIIFEGGRSRSIDEDTVKVGMQGVLNVAASLGIKKKTRRPRRKNTYLTDSHWIRAKASGMLQIVAKNGAYVQKGSLLAYINGPYAQFQVRITARRPGHIICVNESPVVHLGDAVFNIGEPG